MTVTLHTPDGALDLGGTIEFMLAMRELAQVTGEEYPHLYAVAVGAGHDVDEPLSAADAASVAVEAAQALTQGGDRLGEHTRWLLGQLAR